MTGRAALRQGSRKSRQSPFRRILLAVGGDSDRSGAAIELAADVALRSGAEVIVTHVARPARSREREIAALRSARDLADEVAAELTQIGVRSDSEIRVASGHDVAHAISEMARERKADLVVMGSRGLSDAGGLLFGSVSHGVIEESQCPVLVVRRDVWPSAVKRILLGVSGKDEDRSSIEAAIGVARLFDAEVFVVHVAAPDKEGIGVIHVAADALAALNKAGVKASAAVMADRDVAGRIAEAAAQNGADLIVIGSRRLNDLRGLLVNAVSHEIVHRINRPVLVSGRA
jgi:nucleotide-binding universal stress UspA family protein